MDKLNPDFNELLYQLILAFFNFQIWNLGDLMIHLRPSHYKMNIIEQGLGEDEFPGMETKCQGPKVGHWEVLQSSRFLMYDKVTILPLYSCSDKEVSL